ncbi:MAG: hypothetical protein ABWZ64_02685, partial [Xanthobacteraceae bacterium]
QNRVEIPQRSTLSLCGGVISFLSEAREYRAVKRRQFITLLGSAVTVWTLAARAQQSRAFRIGVLLPGTPTSFAPRTQAFVEGLRDLDMSREITSQSIGNGERIE